MSCRRDFLLNFRYCVFVDIYFYITLKRKQFVRCIKGNIVRTIPTIESKVLRFIKKMITLKILLLKYYFNIIINDDNYWYEKVERKKQKENVPYPHSILVDEIENFFKIWKLIHIFSFRSFDTILSSRSNKNTLLYSRLFVNLSVFIFFFFVSK